jgi:hypothetical protein
MKDWCGGLKNIKVVTTNFKAVSEIYPAGLRKNHKKACHSS